MTKQYKQLKEKKIDTIDIVHALGDLTRSELKIIIEAAIDYYALKYKYDKN